MDFAAYYQANKERIKARVSAYKKSNREKYRAYGAIYRRKHAAEIKEYSDATKDMQKVRSARRYQKSKDKVLAYGKEYYLKNKERVRKRNAKWLAKNRDSVRAQQKEYRDKRRQNDPIYVLINIMRRRMLNALNGVARKSARTLELLGCDGDFLHSYLEKQFKPGMSWENRHQWHIDHIKPLALFDLTKPEEQRAAFHYSNLQPLWAKENRQKWMHYA